MVSLPRNKRRHCPLHLVQCGEPPLYIPHQTKLEIRCDLGILGATQENHPFPQF